MPNSYLSPTLLAALFTFAAVNSATPGPNNIMLATSGMNFGIRRTLPQMAGIFTGLILILIATGLGLGFVFSHFPPVRFAVMVMGVGYTLWLAFRIAKSGSLGGGALAHPLRYLAAVAFQWVNPKLWMMAITATAIYVRPAHMLADTALVTCIFSLVNIPCMIVWAGFGAVLREALRSSSRIRVFNMVMGVALALSILPLLRA